MAFAAGNAQHIGARPQQQDAFGFSDPSDRNFVAHGGFLGIVADGVGGLTHGSEASQSAVRAFLQAYQQKSAIESIPAALARALHEANAAVLRVASEPSGEGAGTTLIAAVLHENSLYWISAGDSRIYLLHDGRLSRVTSDHTYAHELDEQAAQGKISRAEAQSHSERGALTSYLGQSEPKKVDKNTRPLALQPDDSVILCTDGFYRALDDAEIAGAFGSDLHGACESLVKQILAKQRKGQDNLTVIALKQSRRSRKSWLLSQGSRGERLKVVALGLAAVAIIAAAGYWHEKHRASVPQVQQPHAQPAQTTNQVANPGEDASKQMSPKAVEAPQVEEAKPETPAQPVPPVQSRRQRTTQKPKGPVAKKRDQVAMPSTTPEQKTTPQNSAPVPEQNVSGDAAPASGQPAAATNPPAAPSGQGQTAPGAQTPPTNPEKPPAMTPATPDSPGEDKPNSPPNLSLHEARELGIEIGIKDGKRPCHS